MLSEANILYTPETNYTGLDSFNYIICNFYGCDSPVVLVDVLCADPGSGNAITGFAFIDDNINKTMEVGENGHENLKVLLYDDIDQDG
jgi:hypothetical protein